MAKESLDINNEIAHAKDLVNVHPSLFIVSLKYRLPLGQIDAIIEFSPSRSSGQWKGFI
jgi:hypothetical protein